jgi:hypothetical protein
MVFVGFLAQKMFMSKIVKKIYHIRKYDNLDHEIEKRKHQDTSVTHHFAEILDTSIEH